MARNRTAHRHGTAAQNRTSVSAGFRRAYARNYWHRSWYAQRRFRIGAYRVPNGWSWQNWAIGAYLPAAWWAGNYWLGDWWYFGLPEPPLGFVWVRVGPNAMLVDEATGQIAEIEYDLFFA